MEFNNILVPVIGTEADDEAVRLACRLARQDKSRIWVAFVITVERTLPIEVEIQPEIKKAEEILDHMERVAAEQGCKIETDLLQAREAGPTIIDEALGQEVDLIVIGITYKRRFGQFSLGSVVPYVLRNAPCRVILYHQYSN
jgi:nucleotide-binding universal stress UspA family protein